MRSFNGLWMLTQVLGLVLGLVLGMSACASGPTPLERRQAQTHRDLADLKLHKGETNFAVREYLAALELDPEDAEAYFGLGEAFRRRGDFSQAERHFRRAFEVDPGHQDAMFNLGAVYIQQERYADAIEISTRLAEDPTFLRPERALVNRGWAHYKSGDLEGAREDFEEALAGNGADTHARLNLGIVLYAQGNTLDAMLQFERVLQLIEKRPNAVYGGLAAQAHFHLAEAHVKLGQRSKAIEQLRLASERGGKDEWAEKSRAYRSVLPEGGALQQGPAPPVRRTAGRDSAPGTAPSASSGVWLPSTWQSGPSSRRSGSRRSSATRPACGPTARAGSPLARWPRRSAPTRTRRSACWSSSPRPPHSRSGASPG